MHIHTYFQCSNVHARSTPRVQILWDEELGSIMLLKEKPCIEFLPTFLPRGNYTFCREKITLTAPNKTHLLDLSKEINISL